MNYFPPASLALVVVINILQSTPGLKIQNQIVEMGQLPVITMISGTSRTVTVPFRIEYGYHIQADTVNDENLIPAELMIESIEGMALGKPAYPDYREFQLKGTDQKLLVFDGELNIVVRISASGSVREGSYTLPGSLYYQACDSVRCLFPRKLDFNVTVNVID